MAPMCSYNCSILGTKSASKFNFVAKKSRDIFLETKVIGSSAHSAKALHRPSPNCVRIRLTPKSLFKFIRQITGSFSC